MNKYYDLPNPNNLYPVYTHMLSQTHLLIAGTTGSGKSVLINGLINTALTLNSPVSAEFIFIDLKRVELCQYKELPHCKMYADNIDSAVSALKTALKITEKRYQVMQQANIKKYHSSVLYVVIDELADLMTVNKKAVIPLLQRICQIGRAANIHVIAATQCPLATVIPTQIKVNFDSRIGLRTLSAQDSRNILGFSGCEKLPKYGKAYYMSPDYTELQLINIPMINDSELNNIVSFWKKSIPHYEIVDKFISFLNKHQTKYHFI